MEPKGFYGTWILSHAPRSPRAMAPEQSTLGTCPLCDSELTQGALLIEYETETGISRFVECHECNEPVHPQ